MGPGRNTSRARSKGRLNISTPHPIAISHGLDAIAMTTPTRRPEYPYQHGYSWLQCPGPG